MTNERRIRDGVQMLRWLEKQGVIFYSGREERAVAKGYLREAAAIFPELTSKLCAVYLYRADDQPGESSGWDGVCWWRETPNGMQYAVGLAVEALEQGRNYFVGLFLHELAHLTNGPHTTQGFYSYLGELAEQYSRITGEPIFPDHNDFEPYAPPSGPGRPRKAAYRGPDKHSAAAARQKMIDRQRRTAFEGFGRAGIFRTSYNGLYDAVGQFLTGRERSA